MSENKKSNIETMQDRMAGKFIRNDEGPYYYTSLDHDEAIHELVYPVNS